jgi:hypothetical protein
MIPNHSNDNLKKKSPLIEKFSTTLKSCEFSVDKIPLVDGTCNSKCIEWLSPNFECQEACKTSL